MFTFPWLSDPAIDTGEIITRFINKLWKSICSTEAFKVVPESSDWDQRIKVYICILRYWNIFKKCKITKAIKKKKEKGLWMGNSRIIDLLYFNWKKFSITYVRHKCRMSRDLTFSRQHSFKEVYLVTWHSFLQLWECVKQYLWIYNGNICWFSFFLLSFIYLFIFCLAGC